MKRNNLSPGIIKVLILGIILAIMGSCEKNGGDNPPVDPNDSIPTDSLYLEISESVSSIDVGKDNTKWIGTKTGLYKSVSGGYNFVDTLGDVAINTLLYEEASNLFWVGTTQGILKVTISGAEVIDYSNISVDKLSHPNIRASFLEGSNKWFGTDLGFSLNHNDYWKNDSFRINFASKLFPMDIEDVEVNSIAEWDGDYFFATNVRGLYRATDYDESVDAFSGATQWKEPYNGENLSSNMNVVFVDSKGNQWMGGVNGVQVHKGHDPKNMDDFMFFKDELASNTILTITEAPDGKIWIGTDLGISIYNGSTWSTLTENLPDLYIQAIAFDNEDGSAWIGTKKGLVNIK